VHVRAQAFFAFFEAHVQRFSAALRYVVARLEAENCFPAPGAADYEVGIAARNAFSEQVVESFDSCFEPCS
jgi:hypothetical protein